MDRLARDAEAPRDLHHRNPVADHREYRLIPLLYDTQLHKRFRSVERCAPCYHLCWSGQPALP